VNDLVDSAGSAQGIGYLPVLIILVLIIGAILNGIQQYFIQKVAESVARDARTQLVRKILRIPLDALEKYTKGDILSRVINDTMLLRRCLTEGFVQSFVGVFTLIGAVIGMFFIDPLLLAISAVISLLAVVSVTMATSKGEKSNAQMHQAGGGSGARARPGLVDNPRNIKEISHVCGPGLTPAGCEWPSSHADCVLDFLHFSPRQFFIGNMPKMP